MCSLHSRDSVLRCWCLHAREVVGQFQRFEGMPFDEVVLDGVLTGIDGWESQLLYVRHGDSEVVAILPQMPMSMASR